MRLPIFALSVGTLLGTAAAAQTQAVLSASSRPQDAAITATPLPYREETLTFDAARRSPLHSRFRPLIPQQPGSARRVVPDRPSARGVIHAA
jgi:hypothetical protein